VDAAKHKIARGIEQNFILPNHKEMIEDHTKRLQKKYDSLVSG
jgi:hypothetical protein